MSTQQILDRILQSYNAEEFLENDPLGLLHRYERKLDIEAIGLIASCLSCGRKGSFTKKIRRIMEVLGRTPGRQWKREVKTTARRLHDFSYRWIDNQDLRDLLYAIHSVFHKHGSLENAYEQAGGSSHVEKSTQFVRMLRQQAVRNSIERGFNYLLPDPGNGSPCKRLHMFFRWMVRPSPDMDLWSQLKPSELIIPLDTHVHNTALEIGLTERKTADITAAREITDALRAFDPEDPVKYDIPLHVAGVNDIPLTQ